MPAQFTKPRTYYDREGKHNIRYVEKTFSRTKSKEAALEAPNEHLSSESIGELLEVRLASQEKRRRAEVLKSIAWLVFAIFFVSLFVFEVIGKFL